jgi:trimeric autotransporter adhesin
MKKTTAISLAFALLCIFSTGTVWAGHETDSNTWYGYTAGSAIIDGCCNSFFGAGSGAFTNHGTENTFVGNGAGWFNTTGSGNTFVGRFAGSDNIDGSYNTFVGSKAGLESGSGINNTYVGQAAGYTAKGSGNVFIGNGAGYHEETGSNKLYIDNYINSGTAPLISGDFNYQYVKINGYLIMASDKRMKKNIEPLTSSLDKVMHLRGVSYDRTNVARDKGFGARKEIGLIAQEVEQTLPELVHTDDKGYKAIAYDKLVPVLIEAIKEQQQIVDRQKKALADESKMVDEQRKSLAAQSVVIKTLADRIAKLEKLEARVSRIESKDMVSQK